MADENEQFQNPDEANTDKEEKPKRTRNRTGEKAKVKKGEVHTADYCSKALYTIYVFIARICGLTQTKKEKDFLEDGATLSRLSERFSMIGFILKMLDPAFFIIGTLNKYADLFNEWKEKQRAKKEAKAAQKQIAAGVNPSYDSNNEQAQFQQ